MLNPDPFPLERYPFSPRSLSGFSARTRILPFTVPYINSVLHNALHITKLGIRLPLNSNIKAFILELPLSTNEMLRFNSKFLHSYAVSLRLAFSKSSTKSQLQWYFFGGEQWCHLIFYKKNNLSDSSTAGSLCNEQPTKYASLWAY